MTAFRIALFAGIGGTVALLLGMGEAPGATGCAYLAAFTWVLTSALGTLIVAMVCDACGAVWFVSVRRAAEACTSALPGLALLFPLLLTALPSLYPWAGPLPSEAHARAAVLHRQQYLNPSAFAARAAVAFACWILIGELMRYWSLRQDARPAGDLSHRRRALASGGLIPMAFSVTSVAVDWLMSTDATWASSIVGLQLLVAAFTAGTCAIILVSAAWSRRDEGCGISAEHRHALGKLLFVGVVLWAYLAFMQLLVVWMGDLPDEAAWYVPRLTGAWGWLAAGTWFLHFIVPFSMLLPRTAKRDGRILVAMAICVLVAHACDLAWIILPSLPTWNWSAGAWRYLAAMLALCGCIAALAAWRTRGIDSCPRGDPDLIDALAYRSQP